MYPLPVTVIPETSINCGKPDRRARRSRMVERGARQEAMRCLEFIYILICITLTNWICRSNLLQWRCSDICTTLTTMTVTFDYRRPLDYQKSFRNATSIWFLLAARLDLLKLARILRRTLAGITNPYRNHSWPRRRHENRFSSPAVCG